MRFGILLLIIAGVAWVLLRSVRDQRRRWLERVALPGTWRSARDGVRSTLTFEGDLDGGRYVESVSDADGDRREAGRWRLVEDRLIFTPDDGRATPCEFRFFEAGRIGVHGDGREKRIYEKSADNVVRLPRSDRA